GSIPIVRETGGLKDTITPYNQYTGEGNGFSFANYNAHEMFYCIKSAIDIYKNKKDVWSNLVRKAMNTDSSWNKSAKLYLETYNEISK
ncbi:MAG: starch synthase, partial [Peptostreptococcaceae bacterium]